MEDFKRLTLSDVHREEKRMKEDYKRRLYELRLLYVKSNSHAKPGDLIVGYNTAARLIIVEAVSFKTVGYAIVPTYRGEYYMRVLNGYKRAGKKITLSGPVRIKNDAKLLI
jgi:hypothetical protein